MNGKRRCSLVDSMAMMLPMAMKFGSIPALAAFFVFIAPITSRLGGTDAFASGQPTESVESIHVQRITVGLEDGARTKPSWRFAIRMAIPAHNKDRGSVARLTVLPGIASVTARDLQNSGALKVADVNAEGSYSFNKEQKFVVYIEESEVKKLPSKTTYAKMVGGKWIEDDKADVYEAIVNFTILERADTTIAAKIKVRASNNGVVTAIDWTQGVRFFAKGSIHMMLVPDELSSYAGIRIGAAKSGEEAGGGYAKGNWHSPKFEGRKEGIAWTPITVKPTKINDANPDAKWSFDWEKE